MKPNSPEFFTKCQHDLKVQGYFITEFPLSNTIKKLVETKNYLKLDQELATLVTPSGSLYLWLNKLKAFNEIEFILSLREAKNDWEEDGIWHDDGSRLLAFSLSLTLNKVAGGHLGFRTKGQKDSVEITTPAYGNIIVFSTGVDNYEHKIHAVKDGSRLVMAGWCS